MNKPVLKVAVLDDNEDHLEILRRKLNKFMKATKTVDVTVKMEAFTDPEEFIQKFNHDLGLIDLRLDHFFPRGAFDVAQRLRTGSTSFDTSAR